MNLSPDLPYKEARFLQRSRPEDVEVDSIVLRISNGWANADRLGDYYQAQARELDRAAAHFGIGRKGSPYQYAPLDSVVLHTRGRDAIEWDGMRQINERSVGVVLCNAGPVKERYAKSKRYARRAPHGFVRAAHEKTMQLRSWERFTYEQLEQLVEVVELIVAAVPTIKYVCGGEDLSPQATDPGPLFPWELFRWHDYGLMRVEKDWKTGKWSAWHKQKRRPFPFRSAA